MEFKRAFKKPFSDINSLLIGIGLSILPIINLFAAGYVIKLAKDKGERLPRFRDWGDLFVKGLLSFVIHVAYSLPAIIVLMTAGLALFASLIEEAVIGELDTALILSKLLPVLPIVIFALLLFLLAAYVSPSAIINFVLNDEFTGAFDFPTVFRKAFTADYFIAWLVSIGTYIILGALIGWIFLIGGAITMFVGGVITYTLLGDAIRRSK